MIQLSGDTDDRQLIERIEWARAFLAAARAGGERDHRIAQVDGKLLGYCETRPAGGDALDPRTPEAEE